MTDKPLTEKQRAFVAAYVGEAKGNATQAARLAGYGGNDRTLAEQGRRLLTNEGVRQALERFRAEMDRGRRASAERVHEFLTQVMEAELTEVTVTVNKNGEFVENEAPPRVRDRITAALGLAKVCGYEAPAKTEHSGTVGLEIALTAEQDAALAEYLEIRDDPVIKARMAELRGEG